MENMERFNWIKNMDIAELTRQRDYFMIALTTAVRQLGGEMEMGIIDVINFEDGMYELHVTTDEMGNSIIRVTDVNSDIQ